LVLLRLKIYGKSIERVRGIWMDEGLTYSVHVGKMVNKFEKRMNIITGCK